MIPRFTPRIPHLFFAAAGKIPSLSRKIFISCLYRIILFHRTELSFDKQKRTVYTEDSPAGRDDFGRI